MNYKKYHLEIILDARLSVARPFTPMNQNLKLTIEESESNKLLDDPVVYPNDT